MQRRQHTIFFLKKSSQARCSICNGDVDEASLFPNLGMYRCLFCNMNVVSDIFRLLTYICQYRMLHSSKSGSYRGEDGRR
jgi:hypothetical protein